jgi:predicted nucleic acid-binding protein
MYLLDTTHCIKIMSGDYEVTQKLSDITTTVQMEDFDGAKKQN